MARAYIVLVPDEYADTLDEVASETDEDANELASTLLCAALEMELQIAGEQTVQAMNQRQDYLDAGGKLN